MRGRKSIGLCLLTSMIIGMLVGCSCSHRYTSTETAGIFADKQIHYTCTECGHTYSETVAPATKSIKILAIGNSFNNNSSSLLYDIAKDAGAEDIVIGCLWIGGSQFSDHAANIKSSAKNYEYRKNTTGKWITRQNYTMLQGLQDEDWDFIAINQSSLNAGLPDQYGTDLETVSKFLHENKPEGAELWFNMTWAYDADYTANANFGTYYDFDPQKMYEAIRETCRTTVMDSGYYEGLITCGTTMQNMRTAWVSDLITQDGYHASLHLGCYALGVTWLATFTDVDVEALDWFPRQGSRWGLAYDNALREAAKEAVINTMKSPFEPTASTQHVERPDFEAIH